MIKFPQNLTYCISCKLQEERKFQTSHEGEVFQSCGLKIKNIYEQYVMGLKYFGNSTTVFMLFFELLLTKVPSLNKIRFICLWRFVE